MRQSQRFTATSLALTVSLLLTACGGGGSTGSTGNQPASNTISSGCVDIAPAAIASNTATEGFNQLNLRRAQMGLLPLSRNALIDNAAQGHSIYQKVNDTISHQQTSGRNCFSGITVLDRLTAAQYKFNPANSYAYGEVISASGDLSGANNAEDLVTAIYHRFVMFEPKFKEAGAGSFGFSATGYNFFTVEFAANGLSGGLGAGNFVIYPFVNQTGIPTIFAHKQESPDPVPDQLQDFVGYPVSVHADIDTSVTVTSFTLRPRGGQFLPTRLLSAATDPSGETPASAAAIIPLSPLTSATTYDVQFIGTVSGTPATRSWSFTTK